MAGWGAKRLITVRHSGSDLSVAKRLVGLANGELSRTIVVGLPLHKDGAETHQAKLTRDFALLLASCAGESFKVYLIDERYSSAAAQARLKARRSEDLDDESACVILEAFYANPSSAEVVPFDKRFAEEYAEMEAHEQRKIQFERDLANELALDRAARSLAAPSAENASAEPSSIDTKGSPKKSRAVLLAEYRNAQRLMREGEARLVTTFRGSAMATIEPTKVPASGLPALAAAPVDDVPTAVSVPLQSSELLRSTSAGLSQRGLGEKESRSLDFEAEMARRKRWSEREVREASMATVDFDMSQLDLEGEILQRVAALENRALESDEREI